MCAIRSQGTSSIDHSSWMTLFRLFLFLALLNFSFADPKRRLLQTSGSLTAEDLAASLATANQSSTIELDVETITLDTLLTISTENLRLEGVLETPTTFLCEGEGRVEITASKVRLENIGFENCVGGAVTVINLDAGFNPFELDTSQKFDSVDIELNDVYFRNNSEGMIPQRSTAGALTLGPGTSANLKKCEFVNNSASTGGAILVDGSASLLMEKCRFEDNTAVIAGGAIAAGLTPNYFKREANIMIHESTFLRNRDLSGAGDPAGLVLPNGAPLESSVFLKFPSPSASGGAIFVSGYNKVLIEKSIFEENTAVPAGGALFIQDNQNVQLINSTFTGNTVTSRAEDEMLSDRTTDLEQGGAVYLAFIDVHSQATFSQCYFNNNSAAYGGALHVVTALAGTVKIEHSQFDDNNAVFAGGAMVVRNTVQVRFQNVRFNRNKATSGGGVMFTNGGGAMFFSGLEEALNIYFTDNKALDGAGLFLLGCGRINLQVARFYRNLAERNGGGVCVVFSLASGLISINSNYFEGNAAKRGGAIFLNSAARFEIVATGEIGNQFVKNKALAGGAMHIFPSSEIGNIIRLENVKFKNNEAVLTTEEAGIDNLELPSLIKEASEIVSDIGRRLLRDLMQNNNGEKTVLLKPDEPDPCRPGGGGALCLITSTVPERTPIEIKLGLMQFIENKALVGGAVFVASNLDSNWIADCESDGSATESLEPKPCRSFLFSGVEFLSNKATAAAGAIFVSHPHSVFYSTLDETPIPFANLTADDPIFFKNKVSKTGYGNNIASTPTHLEFIEPNIKEGKLLFKEHNSGEELPKMSLVLKDHYNQNVTDGIRDSIMTVAINSSVTSGQTEAKAANGVVTFTKVVALGEPTEHPIIFVAASDTTKNFRTRLTIRQCIPGEARIEELNVCDVCDREYFGFNYNYSCDGCPSHARCDGGAVLIPEHGYWHSTPYSPLIHKCILEEACSFDGRTQGLRAFYADPFALTPSNEIIPNDVYPQCQEEYMGPVCGSCIKGYGHVIGGECHECQHVWITAALIGIVTLWTFFVLASTAQAATDTIREMHDLRMVRAITMSRESTSTKRRKQQNKKTSSGQERSPEASTPGSKTVWNEDDLPARYESLTGDNNTDHIMISEKISEIIKIFVNFFQMASVGGGIDTSWTISVYGLLSIEDTVSNVSGGISFAPMECLMKNLEDRTIIGVVLRTLFPLIVTALYIIFSYVRHRRLENSHDLRRRLIIGFIVGMFFAYETVTEMMMRLVSCIQLDDVRSSEELGIPYGIVNRYGDYASARDRYWVEDTNHICWEGSHRLAAGILAVPGLAIITAGIPIGLAAFLLYKRYRGVVLEPECLNTYGFVYQSYHPRFVYWESVIMLRKISLAAVIVFAYDLGPNLQSAIALGILICALLMHFLTQPFKHVSLNVLESLSLLASIGIFYGGVIFKDPNTSDSGRIFLSILIVLTNLAMVCIFVYKLFMSYDYLFIVKLRLNDINPIPPTFIGRVTLLSRLHAKAMKETLQRVTKSKKREKNVQDLEVQRDDDNSNEQPAEIQQEP